MGEMEWGIQKEEIFFNFTTRIGPGCWKIKKSSMEREECVMKHHS